MEIKTKYDPGQWVYVKTDKFSPWERVDCPECDGLGRVKGKFGPDTCDVCDGDGKIVDRKVLVVPCFVSGIRTFTHRTCNNHIGTDVYYSLVRLDVITRGEEEFRENDIYPTFEEAEQGVCV